MASPAPQEAMTTAPARAAAEVVIRRFKTSDTVAGTLESRTPDDLLAAVRRFVDDAVLPNVDAWDAADALPGEAVAELRGLGLTGALVPSEYGGPGCSVADLVPAWRTLSQTWVASRHRQRGATARGSCVACRALGIIDRCLASAVEESTTREVGDGLLGGHTHAQIRVGEMVARRAGIEALIDRAAGAVDARADDARTLSTAAKIVASDTSVWAVDRAARLAASRSYAAGDELARLRRDAPQTQIGEGANDALLLALARPVLSG